MNPSRRGDETEAVILASLMNLGFSVSVPFGDSDRYDLVVDDHETLSRVQCKTGNWVNGSIRFNLYSSTVGGDGRVDADYTARNGYRHPLITPTSTLGCVSGPGGVVAHHTTLSRS
ncbi:group I intron-associated PD-(D/E)XK endonuclease [Haloprofundus salinisoli]|uniref:group I intron-associated PD-(D/E)XK endonuclease n=1 Tax=Haloprofundus salinisoli TaxID=2876193 RepID=UPI001CCCBCD4|nr:group I intron-associated PD-(D/E)XK endonuclease [Haloprofundus salinisoli]